MPAVLPLILKTNAARATPVTINDLGGIIFSANGADPETFDQVKEVEKLQASEQLRALLVDDAHTGSSTMVLNDGSGDIPQADALDFLDSALLAFGNDPYNIVKRNSSGQIDADLDFDGTAEIGSLRLKTAMNADSQQINNLAAGVASGDAVNKGQLDAVVAGLKPKGSVRVLADSNQALSGLPTIDSVGPLTDSQKVLLIAQTAPAENGIWEVHSGAWTRPSNFAAGSEAAAAHVFVEEGTVYADQGWLCVSDSPTLVDTDAQTWDQFSGQGSQTTRKEWTFGLNDGVPKAGGVVALNAPGPVPTSFTEKRMNRAGTITGASIQVDAADTVRAHKLSIRINGSEVALLALGTSQTGAHTSALSVGYVAGDRLSVYAERTSGTAEKSTFDSIVATVEVEETV